MVARLTFTCTPEDEYLLMKIYNAGEFKSFSAFMRTILHFYFDECASNGFDLSFPEEVVILDDRAWKAQM